MAVRNVVETGKMVVRPDVVPKQIGEWVVTEVLTPTCPNVGWLNRFEAYKCIRMKCKMIGDDTIIKFYPRQNESNRNQATELLKGGNLLLTTSFVYQICCSTKDETEVFLFKSICIPSVKTSVISANEDNTKEVDGYRIYMAFNTNDGQILPYPFTCCGCYYGRAFCLHLLAMLIAFRQIQRCSSIELFEETWPPAPTIMQGIPTLLETICIQERESRNNGQKARKTPR